MIIFFSNNKLFSQPTEIVTPTPCIGFGIGVVGCDHNETWSAEPKTKTISIGECQYTIYYHDRIRQCPQLCGPMYETNVVAIVYAGMGCPHKTNGEIVFAFLQSLYENEMWQQPYINYYPMCLIRDHPDWDFYADFDTWATGDCFTLDEHGIKVPCDSNHYCCHTIIRFDYKWDPERPTSSITLDSTYNDEPVVRSVYTINGFEEPECPCESDCNTVIRTPKIANYNTCNAPCSDNPWVVEPVEMVPLSECPTCSVEVHYKIRESNPCPQINMSTFNDISLDEISLTFDGICDSACVGTIPMNDIHSEVVHYLLKNKFKHIPAPGNCATYYRLFQSSCWSDGYDGGYWHYWRSYEPPYGIDSAYIPGERVMRQCEPSNCCWSQYQICNDGGNPPVIRYTLYDQYSDPEPCYFMPYPCEFICNP